MTIIRNGIGSSAANVSNMLSILRTAPTIEGRVNPNGTANYTWDGSDNGQLSFTKKAQAYGNITVIADAWSAPPFMKTNNDEIYSGYICGVTGTSCATGDWRQAYANYLAQYVGFYAQEGIPIKYIGFVNEPDLNEPYPSMGTSGAQAADFINVLYPTLKAANLSTGISCCDGSGWYAESVYTSGLASVASKLAIRSSHPYSTPATYSLTTLQPTWQTEWSNQKGANYTTEWYSGENNPGEGLIWATNIYTGLTSGNCSAYLYWQGAQYGEYVNTALLSVNFDGTLTVPKRLWAFAQFSRGVRPGAVRVATTSSTTNVKLSAFQNLDGSLAIQTINSASSAYNVTLTLKGLTGMKVASWLTDNNNNFTAWDGALTSVTGSVPPCSFVSFIVS
ncbi:hypothetical protein D0Z07_0827 [Hyphodiscus hymeniophilus]|uniref:Glycoside hydrolase family 30 protein n=1 Tax=Hyphodiscus hymeniophilus TaxID=353542 RepID=A0A9P6VPL9_9HELO|nr:hypothetical protein D0Z07_0827 [Hyphodiscus hymeniophilus]